MDWVYALSGIAASAGVSNPDNYTLDPDPITQAELFTLWVRGELSDAPASIFALARPPSGSAWRVARASYLQTAGQSWPTNGTDATVFTSSVASLGTASRYYGAQDKLVAAQLGLARSGTAPPLSPRLAEITLVQGTSLSDPRNLTAGIDVRDPFWVLLFGIVRARRDHACSMPRSNKALNYYASELHHFLL